MRFIFLLLLTLSLLQQSVNSSTFLVGTNQKYKVPSQVSSLVQNGDTVLIESGEYKGDVTSWYKNNLLIKGINGIPMLKAEGKNAQGKAIWVIAGSNVRVENIDFSGCKVDDFNGAGIRYEGKSLFLKNCFFHENEMGILTINDPETEIYFESCEFYNNGYGDGYSHNIYIGKCKKFEMKFCYSHHAKIGHNVKSRAALNIITYNRIMDEATGTSSMLIDLPNGGNSLIMGNELMESQTSENRNLISYGMETDFYPESNLFIINNTMISTRANSTFLKANPATKICVLKNNIFGGNGIIVDGLKSCDSSGNFYTNNISNLKLKNLDSYNYELTSSSPVINKGVVVEKNEFFNLTPDYEYVHPRSFKSKNIIDKIDIGAHEFIDINSVTEFDSNSLEDAKKIIVYDYLGTRIVEFNENIEFELNSFIKNSKRGLFFIWIDYGEYNKIKKVAIY